MAGLHIKFNPISNNKNELIKTFIKSNSTYTSFFNFFYTQILASTQNLISTPISDVQNIYINIDL